MDNKFIVELNYTYEGCSELYHIYNSDKKEIEELWNKYNILYGEGAYEGAFDDYMDEYGIQYDFIAPDLSLVDNLFSAESEEN